jgi:hypothetical protein
MKFLNKYYKDLKDHDDEKFKFITYPTVRKDYHVISNYGKVINFTNNHILKSFDNRGYKRIGLFIGNDGKKVNVSIHRLVCWEYCKHKEGCNVVNHIDSNPSNNYYKNLEWTTVKGNTDHAIKMGNMKVQGTDNGNAKYDESQVIEICEYLAEGYSANEIFKILRPGKYERDDPHLYSLIRRIRDKKAHWNISNNYIFPESSKRTAVVYWDKKDTDELTELVLKGYSNKEILSIYKSNQSLQRTLDKLKYIRGTIRNGNFYND